MNESYPIGIKWFWWLIGLTSFLLFLRLGSAPVYILDEAKNAQCAREMFEKHEWIVPTFNGELRTDKPALHYWFMILAYKTFGVNAFAARFFSVLMGIGTILITFLFTARWLNRGIAFFTSLVLALSAQFLFEFRLSVPDPYLIFFTTAGLLSAYSYLETKKWKWLVLMAVSLALATLAKGPVALALPGLCILAFLVFSKRWHELLDPKFFAAAVIYAVIAIPWYYAVHKATNGLFTKGFFFEHNLNRFSSQMEGHGGPFIITPLIVLIGLLPLSAFIFSIFRSQTGIWRNPVTRFGLLAVIIYTAFFSISSTKLPNYPMPCYPFVALLLGFWINKLLVQRKRVPLYGYIILLVIGIAIPVGGFFALRHEAETAAVSLHAFWLLFLPLGVIILMINRNKWMPRKQLLRLSAIYFLFNLVFITILYPMIYLLNPVTKTYGIIGKTNYRLVAYQDFNPAFLFNRPGAAVPVPVFQQPDSLKMALAKWPVNDTVTYIITKQDRLLSIDTVFYEVISRHHDLFENPTTILLKKK